MSDAACPNMSKEKLNHLHKFVLLSDFMVNDFIVYRDVC